MLKTNINRCRGECKVQPYLVALDGVENVEQRTHWGQEDNFPRIVLKQLNLSHNRLFAGQRNPPWLALPFHSQGGASPRGKDPSTRRTGTPRLGSDAHYKPW